MDNALVCLAHDHAGGYGACILPCMSVSAVCFHSGVQPTMHATMHAPTRPTRRDPGNRGRHNGYRHIQTCAAGRHSHARCTCVPSCAAEHSPSSAPSPTAMRPGVGQPWQLSLLRTLRRRAASVKTRAWTQWVVCAAATAVPGARLRRYRGRGRRRRRRGAGRHAWHPPRSRAGPPPGLRGRRTAGGWRRQPHPHAVQPGCHYPASQASVCALQHPSGLECAPPAAFGPPFSVQTSGSLCRLKPIGQPPPDRAGYLPAAFGCVVSTHSDWHQA